MNVNRNNAARALDNAEMLPLAPGKRWRAKVVGTINSGMIGWAVACNTAGDTVTIRTDAGIEFDVAKSDTVPWIDGIAAPSVKNTGPLDIVAVEFVLPLGFTLSPETDGRFSIHVDSDTRRKMMSGKDAFGGLRMDIARMLSADAAAEIKNAVIRKAIVETVAHSAR